MHHGPDMKDCRPTGQVWVDARDETAKTSPLRFVNGARTAKQRSKLNVEPYVRGAGMFYYTSKPVQKGEEFIVDYGENYWIAVRAMEKLDEFHERAQAKAAKHEHA